MNKENAELLAEMMLHSAQFCTKAEILAPSISDKDDLAEFRLKLGQARNILERLQEAYNEDELALTRKQLMGEFRQLIIALLWIAFYVRPELDFKLFRMVVTIEASFTYLLLNPAESA